VATIPINPESGPQEPGASAASLPLPVTSTSPPAAEAPPSRDIAIEVWRACRAETESARRRSWQSGLVLGPLAFVPLVLLTRVQCPLAMDFIVLGGSSASMLFLWVYLAERCAADREQAAAQLAAVSLQLALPVPSTESRRPDRVIRLLLALALASLWTWSWIARPDCSTESWTDEPSEMSRT
jgi:hypothetical protein